MPNFPLTTGSASPGSAAQASGEGRGETAPAEQARAGLDEPAGLQLPRLPETPVAGSPALAQGLAATAEVLDAQASDPRRIGWMLGTPTPPELQVRYDDGSMYAFPQLRWAQSNMRRLLPTSHVSRGNGRVAVLPRADRDDLDDVDFLPLGGAASMNWAESLAANYTDGIVVLHRGHIVYERYFGALDENRPHAAWSVTKSLFGLLAATLVVQGQLDERAPVAQHVPELGASGFGNAQLRELLDMTTSLHYTEDDVDPHAGIRQHGRAGGILPPLPGQANPAGFCDFLLTLRQHGPHGKVFAYKTVDTDALGWVLRRVSGLPLGELLSQRLWSQLGAEQDGYMMIDSAGTEFAGGGFNCCLRDLARVGEMMRNHGVWNGRQLVPKAAIDAIRAGGDRVKFEPAGYATLPGASYRDMWWVLHDRHGAYCARGIHGQGLYIAPKAEMVIARFASHPVPGNLANDPTTLPAYRALAERLMKG